MVAADDSVNMTTWSPQMTNSAVLHMLPNNLPLGQALSYHKQEGGCIYVNNAEPWNAIKYLHYYATNGPF